MIIDGRYRTPPLARVFLSYVKEDLDFVKKLDKIIEDNGFQTIVDYKSLRAGENWKNSIRKLIFDSHYFIPCFSSNFNQRYQTSFLRELNWALDKIKDIQSDRLWILPIKIDECSIPENLNIRSGELLTDLHYIDMFPDDNFDNAVGNLISSLKSDAYTPTSSISEIFNRIEEYRYMKEFYIYPIGDKYNVYSSTVDYYPNMELPSDIPLDNFFSYFGRLIYSANDRNEAESFANNYLSSAINASRTQT